MNKSTVTICSSASFYEQVIKLRNQLQTMGYDVIVPYTARKMEEAGTYELDGFKPAVDEAERKAWLMRGHFDEIDRGDICLVVNNDKHGVPNYIGGNVLMEMALAFYQKKPIVLLNDVPEESSFLEEIIGMQPIVLNGRLEDLPKKLAKAAQDN